MSQPPTHWQSNEGRYYEWDALQCSCIRQRLILWAWPHTQCYIFSGFCVYNRHATTFFGLHFVVLRWIANAIWIVQLPLRMSTIDLLAILLPTIQHNSCHLLNRNNSRIRFIMQPALALKLKFYHSQRCDSCCIRTTEQIFRLHL